MKIISLKLIKEGYMGLKKINMTGLGNTVVLVGPNGSGKTRLLKVLKSAMEHGSADTLEYTFSDDTDIDTDNIQVADYSHYDAKLQLPEKFPPFVISSANHRLKICNFEKTKNDALLFIKDLAERGGEELDIFNALLKDFIGEGIILEDGIVKIFNLDFSSMALSPGQQYLLRMCVALHCNDSSIKAPILIFDEPEIHLHPAVLTRTIQKVQKKFLNTQIWIATHSISLLPMFDSTEIWYIENGTVSMMGSNSEKILNGLLGKKDIQDGHSRLRQFIALPEVFAHNHFALESLIAPESIPYSKKDDPQVLAVIQALETIQKKETKIVVDFGVGKGRFIEALSGTDIFSSLEYYAYDKYDNDKIKCEEVISRCNSDTIKYYNDINALKKELEYGADAVFMVNVLHEIPPINWTEVLAKDIYELLNENGLLILVEIEEFTYGELPHKNGFLVQQETSLCHLFAGNHIEPYRHKKRKELISYRIPRHLLKSITKETVLASLKSIEEESIEKIRLIRSSPSELNFRDGIKHAFWAQQFVNARLSTEEINENK